MGVDKYAGFMQMFVYIYYCKSITMTNIVQKPSQLLHLA